MNYEQIKDLMTSAVNRDDYDFWYTCMLYLSGDPSALESAIKGKSLNTYWRDSMCFLPQYPEIPLRLDKFGLQNHGYVNARINVQGVVVMPGLEFSHSNPVVREYNSEFIRTRWDEQDWTSEFYNVYMEVEAIGFGYAFYRLKDGKGTWEYTSALDVICDPNARTPQNIGWVARRKNVPLEVVTKEYEGLLSDEEIKKLTTKSGSSTRTKPGVSQGTNVIVQWEFQTDDEFMIILTSNSIAEPILLRYNAEKKLERASDKKAGPNIFEQQTWVKAVDSYLPLVRTPVGKSTDSMKLAAMLNWVEKYISTLLRNGMPLTTIDITQVTDKKLLEQLKNAKDLDALTRILCIDGDVNNIVNRLPAQEMSQTVLLFRNILKEELNAATGVQDMQRGQALEGERTRYEVQSLNDQAGVQARHQRSTYSRFVRRIVDKTRKFGAKYDQAVTKLDLPTYGIVSTDDFPNDLFLAEPIAVHVNPSGQAWKGEDQRQQEAILKFNTVILKLVAAGVLPMAVVARWILTEIGLPELAKQVLNAPPMMPPQENVAA